MAFEDLPRTAAWRHQDARQGFESVFLHADKTGYRFDGHTAAVEDGAVWVVRYSITVDARWATRSARVWGWSPTGERQTELNADGLGRWSVSGQRAPELDGCLDVDLASSALTNTMPVHRLDLGIGQSALAPAAYVRALDLGVERLQQTYARVDDDGLNTRYDYSAPAFGFRCRLVYDPAGLAIDYPGIATRVK